MFEKMGKMILIIMMIVPRLLQYFIDFDIHLKKLLSCEVKCMIGTCIYTVSKQKIEANPLFSSENSGK